MPAEDMSKSEHLPLQKNVQKPRNQVVDDFREAINFQFVRYQQFYDVTNADMRRYRLAHVDLISSIYMSLMTVMGDRIEEVRIAAYELDDLINARIEDIGETECVLGVIADRDANSGVVGSAIQQCAITANATLTDLLNDVFYPTFALIQSDTSTIPISVIDVLARGNVLEDEQAIIRFLEDRYDAFRMQWLNAVSTLLRWETNKFENDGLFLIDEVERCMNDASWEYLLTNSRLEGEIDAC
jgi:hypothetical protein